MCGCPGGLQPFSFSDMFPWNDVHLPWHCVALIPGMIACCKTKPCADLSPKDPAHSLFSYSSSGVQHYPKPSVLHHFWYLECTNELFDCPCLYIIHLRSCHLFSFCFIVNNVTDLIPSTLNCTVHCYLTLLQEHTVVSDLRLALNYHESSLDVGFSSM